MSLFNLQKQLGQLEAFMKTEAYSSMQTTYTLDIQSVEQSILSLAPLTDEDRVELIRLHEQRTQLAHSKQFFEDALSTLKERISELEDSDTKATDNQTINENS